jgi:hypothetical protein
MFNDAQQAVVKAGHLLFLKLGTMFSVQILSEEVRLLWVAMPRPRYFSSDDFWEGKS